MKREDRVILLALWSVAKTLAIALFFSWLFKVNAADLLASYCLAWTFFHKIEKEEFLATFTKRTR